MQNLLFSPAEECSIPSTNSSIPEICHYLTEHCTGIRHIYLRYYYCANTDSPILSNIVLWLFVITTIGMLFLVLGLLASDYLVPNLSALSEAMKMDEKLAGLTLLAFANSSPDILSTYIALKNGMTTMAIGELLGSANFALTVVIGVLAIYKPFKVNHQTFIRDLVIFSTLLLLSLYILSDGVITMMESVVLCILYVVFILLNFLLPQGEIEEFGADAQANASVAESATTNLTSSMVSDVQPPNIMDENSEENSCNGININSTNMDDQSIDSANSNDSNASNNDYYFAHNIDNLEKGRGYKIALIDSLKLAWLWKRKSSSKVIPTENRDIEQLQPVSEDTPLHSPQQSSINIYDNSNGDEVNINDVTQDNTPHSANTTSQIIYGRKIKDKEDYQILYPFRHSNLARTDSSLSVRNKSPDSSIIFPRNSTPVINIEPSTGQPSPHGEGRQNNNDNGNDNDNDNDSKNDEGKHEIPLPPRLSNTLLLPQSTYHPNLDPPPSPMLRQLSSTSTLIPYVEYQKTKNMLFKICPIHIVTGADSPSERCLAVILLPFSTLANLIIPVPLPGELEGEIFRHEQSLATKLFYFQVAIVPLLLLDFQLSVPLIAVSIALPVVSIALRHLWPFVFDLVFPVLSSICGFLSVLRLISMTATAIISVLKDLAEIYSLNESILGLTILSLGNSVGDLVTNLALAGLGRPLTGLHACFGSPLLYILLGIGACSLIVQLTVTGTGTIEFTVDRSLQLTALSILGMLLLYSVLIPLNNWTFQKWMGYVGVCIWLSVTSFNFVLHRYR